MADWERGDVMRGAGREITKVLNIKAVAAVHKREGILACTLGCCLVCALVLSALLSGKMKSLKAGGTCAITSVVFTAATVWTCKYFLFVTEKIPLVCPEVLYLVLLGIVVRTVIKRHGTA